jgi:hypothetical protein
MPEFVKRGVRGGRKLGERIEFRKKMRMRSSDELRLVGVVLVRVLVR